MSSLTKAMMEAWKWLGDRGGDGVFDKNGVVLAAGEKAPVTRATWNRLSDAGYIEFYNPVGKGYGRLRVMVPGRPKL